MQAPVMETARAAKRSAAVPVRTILRLTSEWIGRLGRVWVEGQIAELTRRGSTAFLTLRDPVAAVSVRVICPRTVLDAAQVQALLDYEEAHGGRPAVITMFERRLTKLSEGS